MEKSVVKDELESTEATDELLETGVSAVDELEVVIEVLFDGRSLVSVVV